MDPVTGQWTYETSGNLYNQYVQSGYFFKIEPTIDGTSPKIYIDGLDNADGSGIKLFYDYLYF